jgi:hypothetical protein
MMKNILKLTISIVLILAGILLLLKEFGVIDADIVKFWPAVLVIIGFVMLYEYFADKRAPSNGLF